MPKGKGTYGSQVGRPPSSNARERSVREYAGGGKVGYNSIGVAKYNKGGKLEGHLKGPSHEDGGIKFEVGGEIQEAEGGEFVVRKDSVHPGTEAVLKYINETGSVPNITDARKRRK